MKRLLFLIGFIAHLVVGSQTLDSLYKELNKPGIDDHIKTEILLNLAWEFRDIRPDSTLYFGNEALRLAQEIDDTHLIIQANNYLGVAYRNLSLYSKSLSKYLLALRQAEEYEDFEQRGYALINIANLYLFQKDYTEAKNYLVQALDQAQQLANYSMMGYCYVNLGRVHRDIQEYDLAEQYFDQASEVRKKLGDEYDVLAVELDKAEVLRLKGSLNEAIALFNNLIPDLKRLNDQRGLTRAYNSIARIHLSRDDFQKAEESASNAIQISQELALKYDEKEALATLSRIMGAKGDFKKAFEYQEKYSNLNYLLFSEEKIRQIEQLKSQSEFEKQEAENELLREQKARQQIISYLLAAIALVVFIAALVAARGYVVKKKLSEKIKGQKEEIEKDKDVIEKQSEKLKELDAAKSRFFANVSHDLRTPLSLIIGNLELVMEDRDSQISQASKRSIETSFKNCKRLIYLTDEINDITRLEEGKIRLKKESVQIVPFLKVLSDMFRSSAEFKGVKLNFDTKIQSSETVSIDSRQFEKIYYNLVSNAIRHTQDGDTITISLEREGDAIMIHFADTGEGIHESVLPNIFDRFYQSKFNEYRTKEGLGIGLALVKDLVELHGGEITASSQLGQGTTFTVSLPVFDSEGVAVLAPVSDYVQSQQEVSKGLEKQARASVDMDAGEPKPRILIVDDHPEIRYYIRQILEEDYNVQEASHGLEALDVLGAQEIDAIITDLMMPWMDGFELIEAIQSNEEMSKIPLLIVSARITDADREQALIQGINNYLQKPFDKRELTLRISNLLANKTSESDFKEVANRQNLEPVGIEILKKLEAFIKQNIEDTNLSVLQLGDAIAASERQVYRLIKKVTGKTPYEYITDVRMQYADYLIRKNMVRSSSEVARSVGIKNVTTFNKQYESRFGKKAADLLDKN